MMFKYRYQSIRNGLVGHWRPSRGPTGNTLIDSVRGNHGTLTNGPTWQASAGGGNGGYSLKLDGTDDYIEFPASVCQAYVGGEVTYSLWVNFVSFTSAYSNLIETRTTNDTLNNYQFAAFVKSNGKLAMYVYQSLVSQPNIDGTGAATLVTNTWYHLAYVYSLRTGLVTYVNGVQDAQTSSGVTGSIEAASARITIAESSFGARWVDGSLDSISFFNRALSGPEILTLYTAGRGGLDQVVRTTTVRGSSASVTVTPGVLALVLTRSTPTISTPRTVTPSVLALSITRSTPTISTPRTVTPSVRALSITRSTPTVSTPRTVTPGVRSLSLTSSTPTVATPRTVTPSVIALSLTRSTPTVSVSSASTVTPGVRSLVITSATPTISTPRTVTPGVIALSLSMLTPTVSGSVTSDPLTITMAGGQSCYGNLSVTTTTSMLSVTRTDSTLVITQTE